MRNSKMLRYGLASVTIFGAGLSAFVVACGDDDSTGPGTSTSSSSSTTSSGGSSTSSSGGGGPDATPDAPAPDTRPNAKLQLVNAAADFGPSNPVGALRICYKVGPSETQLIWAPLPPLPNRKSPAAPFPGVFAGTGGAVDTTGNDLAGLVVVPYLFNATKLEQIGLGSTVTAGGDKGCNELLDDDAGGALTPNADYWVLPAIPAQSFLKEKSYLLVLTGCAGDSTKTATECGTGFTTGAPGVGTLKINRFELNNATTVDADKLGVQFVQASPNIAAVVSAQSGGALTVRPAILTDKTAAGSAKFLAGDGGASSDVAYESKTDLVQISGITFASDVVVPNPNVGALGFSLEQIKALSFGGNVPDGGDYANGKSFTIIAVGDPTTTPDAGNGGANFNTKFFHFLMLPNEPVINSFDSNK